jgi:lipoprotein-anchoring transpeptidase ErfK/SrfK
LQAIKVSISEQTLILYDNHKVIARYSISSGKAGAGNQKSSGKTPLGKHRIRAKIGTGLPINSVLVGRRATGEIYSQELADENPNRDWVLSRILWLSGTEKGFNRLGQVDSMQRYIYIHGTPDSEPMGVAASHGCIRMRNSDLLELFDRVEAYTEVEIIA